jgi:hypothetical protein
MQEQLELVRAERKSLRQDMETSKETESRLMLRLDQLTAEAETTRAELARKDREVVDLNLQVRGRVM